MAAASVVGLNIGQSTICAAEVRGSGGRYEVAGFGVVPTPEGAVMGGSITDPEAVAVAVKELLARWGCKTKQCVSSVSGQGSLVVRVIEVPRMSPKELGDMMKFELERHIPFQAHEVVSDFKPIARATDDPASANMEVLLAAAQQDMITAHVSTVEASGLNPEAVDIEPLAASRVFVDIAGGPQETVALLNIGASSSEISVVRDGVLAFTRTVPLGGDTITQALMDAFQLARPEAERLKRESGNALPPEVGPATGGFAPTPAAGSGAAPDFGPTSAGPVSDAVSFDLDDLGAAPTAAAPAPAGDFQLDFDEPAPAASGSTSTAFDFDLDAEPQKPGATPSAFDLDLDLPASKPATAGGGSGLDLDLSMDTPAPQPALPSVESTGQFGSGPSDLAPLSAADSEAMEIYQAIAPVLEELVAEIRRSLEYFTGRFPDVPLTRMILLGGGSSLKNLDMLLQNDLGIRTAVGNPFQHVQVQSAGTSEEYLKQLGPTMAVAVGLGLRELIR